MGAASTEAAESQQAALSDSARQTMANVLTLEQLDRSYIEAVHRQRAGDGRPEAADLAAGARLRHRIHEPALRSGTVRLQTIADDDRLMTGDRERALSLMTALDARYAAQASAEFERAADQGRVQAERLARSYEEAFDRVGGSAQRTFNEILTRQTTWAKGMTRLIQEVETFFLDEVEAMAARWAASGLASLAGAGRRQCGRQRRCRRGGLGAGLAALVGIGQPGGLFGSGLLSGSGGAAAVTQTAAVSANTTALGAATTAMAALTTALMARPPRSGARRRRFAGGRRRDRGGGRGGRILQLDRAIARLPRPAASCRRRGGGWAACRIRRCDAGLASRAGDGAAGEYLGRLAGDDRGRRRRRRAFSCAFSRPRRRAGDQPLGSRQSARQRGRDSRLVSPERADAALFLT